MMVTKFSPDLSRHTYDAIVIGSGLGGLSTAALLAKEGKRVLVLERHYVPGGFTHTFKRERFVWDVGVHYVGEVHRKDSMGRRIFDHITGGRLEWAPMGDVYDTAVFGGDTYQFPTGRENLIGRLIRHFPGEEGAIRKYFDLIGSFRAHTHMYFGERAMPPFLSRWLGYLLRRGFNKISDLTTYEVLRSFTDNEKLIGVLCAQCGDYGLTPRRSSFAIHALVASHYLEGGNYPVGGASSIHEGVLAELEKHGGQVALNAEVEQVLLHRGKAFGVGLAGGEEVRARIVVSDAGVRNTFTRLLPAGLPELAGIRKDLDRIRPSYSHVCLYLGLDGSDAELGLPRWNYWVYDGYDLDGLMEKYVRDPGQDPPFCYISFPSAKDPTWKERLPGKSTVQVIGVAPYEWFERWRDTEWQRRGDEYEAFKGRLEDGLLRKFFRVIPRAEGHVELCEVSTPLSTRHFSNHPRGEIYGLEHTPERFRLRWLRPHTPVKNLFLTGQDVLTVGVTSAAASGVLTASTILRRNLWSRIMK